MKTVKRILTALFLIAVVVVGYGAWILYGSKRTFLLAEGNTPARDIHIMRNLKNPFRSPWFFLDEDADVLLLSLFPYKSNELRHF